MRWTLYALFVIATIITTAIGRWYDRLLGLELTQYVLYIAILVLILVVKPRKK